MSVCVCVCVCVRERERERERTERGESLVPWGTHFNDVTIDVYVRGPDKHNTLP